MFGINSFEQVGQIAEGWSNYVFGKEEELSEKRMEICKICPLYNKDNDRCDSKKCWDTINNKIVDLPGKNIICGCNCYCKKKTRVKNAKCVLGKW